MTFSVVAPDLFQRHMRQWLCLGRLVVEHGLLDIRENHEDFRTDIHCKPLASQVLVDDRVHTMERPAFLDDRNSTTAGGDDKRASGHQLTDRLFLEDSNRIG